MAKKILQGIQLDTRFTKAMEKVQKAVEDLQMVADDFRDIEGHSPVGIQVMQLKHAAEDFAKLHEQFRAMKDSK